MFVRLWMTPNPVTVSRDHTVAEAHALLVAKNIRRIPVVDADNRLVGIVSRQDIYNVLPSIVDGSSAGSTSFLATSTKIGDIMTVEPMWVTPTTPLETVAQRMRRHKVGGIPVLEDDRLVGIITESDIFAAFMEVLGAGKEGARIEMIISNKSRDLYDIMEIFRQYDISLQAITVHHGFGENQRLVTIRVMGDELDDMLDALRKSGAQINRIQAADEQI